MCSRTAVVGMAYVSWHVVINPPLRAEVLLKAAVSMSVPSGPEPLGYAH